MRSFVKLLLPLISISAISFADCSCESNGNDVVLKAKSQQGKTVLVRMATKPVTKATKEATVCTDLSGKLNVAKLWMQMGEHGHGSAPTQITQETDNCASVKKISFVMTGKWDLQLGFEDGDKLTVGVEVK